MHTYEWYLIKNFYTLAECNEVIEICRNYPSNKLKDNPSLNKKVNTVIVELNKFDAKLDKLYRQAVHINQMWFGFKIYDQRPKGVNFNVYEKDLNEYPYHKDFNPHGTLSDLKLTVVLNLSIDEYEGGYLEFFNGGDDRLDTFNSIGDLLIFPSFNFHRVTPVTRGTRMTLSTWLEGPNLK